MEATSELLVYGDYDVVMQGTSTLSIQSNPYVLMEASSGFYATGNGLGYGGGRAELQAIGARGGVDDPGHGDGYADLPFFTASGSGGLHVPTPTTIGIAYLPSIGGSGVLVRSRAGTGDASLPVLTSLGGDFLYGVGAADLQALTSYGQYGLDRLEANMVDYLIAGSDIDSVHVLTVVFISEGTISDTYSLTRQQVVEFLSELTATDAMSVLGTFTQEFIETLTVLSRNSENIITTGGETFPDLNNEGMVWVVNIDTGASSQYESYGYNSFFVRDGISYGVADDGIYELSGDTDNGVEIEAFADFGRSNFGTSFKKKIPYVYLGIGSDGEMYLKVDSDEEVYIYEMRNNSEAVMNHRVDVGKGLEGNYWNFTLMNKEGSDFDMDAIQFEPIVSSRRIR